ncbi:L,D-transpeptidase family protein [Colwellia ponticola]|uniref:LysM peptidoglycan-binding domain-containing protein n=1 Tax=Colwellia ponticola TaxID=2304625 RepID=A0A8H2JQB9_9GAMM|nr:L,D-transpeptidase family protein [Colwellia ponticola]TMM47965.1 LysM peptidoglycan-binding domain-containing protein [Colwellia ponticola]
MKKYKKTPTIFFVCFSLLLLIKPTLASVYELGDVNKRLIGTPIIHTVVKGDYFQQLAEQYNVGFLALLAANPQQDPFLLKEGTEVVIPNQMLLPFITRKGIVINLPELRLYYFSPEENKVHVFPVGIGRQGLSTPLTSTYIGEKRENPTWRPTQEMQERHFAEHGEYLAKEFPAGPNNPFGKYALRLGTSEYLIHGSNKRFGIGMRASSGCIRMYDDDIKWLFDNVPINTKVRVVNQPVKMSFENGDKQLIEIHQPLTEDESSQGKVIVTKALQKFVGPNREYWQQLLPVIENPHGLVVELAPQG